MSNGVTKARCPVRVQFSIATFLWVILVVAAFFGGRAWERSQNKVERLEFGKGVNSDAGVIGLIQLDGAR